LPGDRRKARLDNGRTPPLETWLMQRQNGIFTFGTLMDIDLLQLVSQQSIDSLRLDPAILADHARRWVLDDHYPALVASPGSSTQGLIIHGLNEEALNRIVFFEGEEFTLRIIAVKLLDGRMEQAGYFAYNQRNPVSQQEWHLEEWQRSTKHDTLPRVERYMQCYGEMSLAEADAYW
jgi:hypothetical protein